MEYRTCTICSHCDLCGKSSGGTSLIDDYATEEIRFLCDDCMTEVNKHLDKLRNLSFSWWHLMIKRFLKNKKDNND